MSMTVIKVMSVVGFMLGVLVIGTLAGFVATMLGLDTMTTALCVSAVFGTLHVVALMLTGTLSQLAEDAVAASSSVESPDE